MAALPLSLLATPEEREDILAQASKLPFSVPHSQLRVFLTIEGGHYIVPATAPKPTQDIWMFLEGRAGQLKQLDPNGHHLSGAEVVSLKYRGIRPDRVRAVLYGRVDCPVGNCRGRCKINNPSSNFHASRTVEEVKLSTQFCRSSSTREMANARSGQADSSEPSTQSTERASTHSHGSTAAMVAGMKQLALQAQVAEAVEEQARVKKKKGENGEPDHVTLTP